MSNKEILNSWCKLTCSKPLYSICQLILIIQSIQTTFTSPNYLSEISHKIGKFMSMFCVMAPCRLVDRYQHFGGTDCLHLQGWRRQCYLSKSQRADTIQKTNTNTFTTVRTSFKKINVLQTIKVKVNWCMCNFQFIVFIYLFAYLFNNDVNRSDHTVLNNRKISE
jgi:hypothetical protein